MHRNYIQMRLCIVYLGVVVSILGDFWEETWWRCSYAQFSPDWDLLRDFCACSDKHMLL